MQVMKELHEAFIQHPIKEKAKDNEQVKLGKHLLKHLAMQRDGFQAHRTFRRYIWRYQLEIT